MNEQDGLLKHTSLCYNQVLLLEPLSNTRPEPLVCNRVIRLIRLWHDLEFGNLELASFVAKFLKAVRKFWEKRLHPSPRIIRESNLRVIPVKLCVVFVVN